MPIDPVSALLQCLASNCWEASLSSSSLAGSRSGLGVWCWMLASWGCVRSSPTSCAVSAWPLVPVPLAPTVLHFGSSLAIGFCRCASDRCWRMSGSFIASSVLSAMSHIRKAGLTSHWSGRCRVWFSCWFLQMFLSMTKAALALPILVTSRSVPPWWSATLPR